MDVVVCLAAAPYILPVVAVSGVAVRATSKGGAFYKHRRVGRHGQTFDVWKLRTMRSNSDVRGPSITAAGDPRITAVGRFLRKTKLDELPQFYNVLRGDMSVVGPRPEAPGYVDTDDQRWREVLKVRPGITDLSSLTFRGEEEVLASARNRELAYREVVLPKKLELALEGTRNSTVSYDFMIIVETAVSILGVHRSRSAAIVRECLLEVEALESRGLSEEVKQESTL